MGVEFIPAVCPNCGGELRVPEDKKTIICMYCGYHIIIHETNNTPTHPSIENWLKLADLATDSNPKEAYEYYSKVLEFEIDNWKAWFGKAKAACKLSTLENPRNDEAIKEVQKSIEYSPEFEIDALKESAMRVLMALVMNYSLRSILENDGFFPSFDRSKVIFSVIDYVLSFTPTDNSEYTSIAEFGISECKNLEKQIPYGGHYDYFRKEIESRLQNYMDKIREITPEHPLQPISKENEELIQNLPTSTRPKETLKKAKRIDGFSLLIYGLLALISILLVILVVSKLF